MEGKIPKTWQEKKIDDLVMKEFPICYGVLKPGYEDPDGIPLIKIVDMEGNRINIGSLFKITRSLDLEFKRSRVSGGEILISIQGTIGRIAVVPDLLKFANISRTIARVKLYPEYNTNYVFHFLASRIGQKRLNDSILGTTRASLNIGTLRLIKIIFPQYEEQSKIAKILSTCDEATDKTATKIEKLKKIKQGLMQGLFRYGIDEHGQIRSESTHRFKNSPLGKIPESWEVMNIADDGIASITTGKSDTQDKVDDGKYPFIVRSDKIERSNNYIFDGEGVLTSGDGVGVGKIYHYMEGKFNFHQRVYLIYNFKKNKLFGRYFFEYFKEHFYNEVSKYSAKTTVDSVRLEMISKMLIPIPNITEQSQIAAILSSTHGAIEKEETFKNKLLAIKAGLMEDLLSGTVRVNRLLGQIA